MNNSQNFTQVTVHQGEYLQKFLRETGKSMEEIASELGKSRGGLYYHFNKKEIDPEFLESLKQHGYNFDPNKIESNAKVVDFEKTGNIIYIPLKAYGGFLQGYDKKVFMDKLERFSLPGIHGEHLAFEVQGTSMIPFAYPGEIVISQKQERLDYMVKGRVYVLQTVDGIILKRFERLDMDKAVFKSDDNSAVHPVIKLKQIKGVYQVVRVLRDPLTT